ncbi:unnamed protein product [Ambrosiozyma monospora]|uniref:Unnamed protein product n=1 Tax=Ambrosiozyma monospora TaxID=43982 RepID=A0A9W7DF92_AMBMO|nr:unnamed protein product [Ambrosiozyma monospora]
MSGIPVTPQQNIHTSPSKKKKKTIKFVDQDTIRFRLTPASRKSSNSSLYTAFAESRHTDRQGHGQVQDQLQPQPPSKERSQSPSARRISSWGMSLKSKLKKDQNVLQIPFVSNSISHSRHGSSTSLYQGDSATTRRLSVAFIPRRFSSGSGSQSSISMKSQHSSRSSIVSQRSLVDLVESGPTNTTSPDSTTTETATNTVLNASTSTINNKQVLPNDTDTTSSESIIEILTTPRRIGSTTSLASEKSSFAMSFNKIKRGARSILLLDSSSSSQHQHSPSMVTRDLGPIGSPTASSFRVESPRGIKFTISDENDSASTSISNLETDNSGALPSAASTYSHNHAVSAARPASPLTSTSVSTRHVLSPPPVLTRPIMRRSASYNDREMMLRELDMNVQHDDQAKNNISNINNRKLYMELTKSPSRSLYDVTPHSPLRSEVSNSNISHLSSNLSGDSIINNSNNINTSSSRNNKVTSIRFGSPERVASSGSPLKPPSKFAKSNRQRSRTLDATESPNQDQSTGIFGSITGLMKNRKSSHANLTDDGSRPSSPCHSRNASITKLEEITRKNILRWQPDENQDDYLDKLLAIYPITSIVTVLSIEDNDFLKKVFKVYLNRFFDFSDEPLDISLRKFLMINDLPKETQQIDRVIYQFGMHYANQHTLTQAHNPDLWYILTYSLIMLHTDRFNPNNKKKMTRWEFIQNLKATLEENDSIEVNELTKNISKDILGYYYDNITHSPFIKILPEQSDQVLEYLNATFNADSSSDEDVQKVVNGGANGSAVSCISTDSGSVPVSANGSGFGPGVSTASGSGSGSSSASIPISLPVSIPAIIEGDIKPRRRSPSMPYPLSSVLTSPTGSSTLNPQITTMARKKSTSTFPWSSGPVAIDPYEYIIMDKCDELKLKLTNNVHNPFMSPDVENETTKEILAELEKDEENILIPTEEFIEEQVEQSHEEFDERTFKSIYENLVSNRTSMVLKIPKAKAGFLLDKKTTVLADTIVDKTGEEFMITRVFKIGMLARQESKIMSNMKSWKKYFCILTSVGLLFFKNITIFKMKYITDDTQEKKTIVLEEKINNSTPTFETYEPSFITAKGMFATRMKKNVELDHAYNQTFNPERPSTITGPKRLENRSFFIYGRSSKDVFMVDNKYELRSWVSVINYLSAFDSLKLDIQNIAVFDEIEKPEVYTEIIPLGKFDLDEHLQSLNTDIKVSKKLLLGWNGSGMNFPKMNCSKWFWNI